MFTTFEKGNQIKAVIKYQAGSGNIRLQDIEDPVCEFDQVKIKVMAASICSSDIMYWLSDNELAYSRMDLPIVLGHEGSGIVESVGKGVKHVKPGDRVVAETTQEVCFECDSCLKGEYNNCKKRKGLGSSANGFFAEYVLASERSVHKIPENLSFEEAALLEPLTCAVHALLDMVEIRPMHHVLVSGPGPIGLFSAQLAKLSGATVILAGTSHSMPRLHLAKDKLQIPYIINSSEEDVITKIMSITNKQGVDFAIDCSGNSTSIQTCIESLKSRGHYICLGVLHSNSDEISLHYNDVFVTRELNLIGARSTTPISWGKSLKLAEEGKIHFAELISNRLPLSEWEKGFTLVKNKNAIKVVLFP
ncbi:MAG: alcohol dehydrogenase catalytic domain-containing protein [Anaerolineaceae bacterium]